MYYVLGPVGALLIILLAWWASREMQRRGRQGWPYALLILLFLPLGLLVTAVGLVRAPRAD